MDDQIPQSFKVEWINTTLKFLKNDNQLTMKYPDMPVNHVEYLHNLIWQRKNNIGLGFKSMYAPVWEAMKIFSLKYQFKVSVHKSEDGKKGHLVIEKVPKNEQENQGTAKQQSQEPAKQEIQKSANQDIQKSAKHENKKLAEQENQKLAKQENKKPAKQGNQEPEMEESQSTDNEDSGQSQSNSPQIKKQTKKKKKKSKSEKFVTDKQKIIESISPVLLRKALQKIMDFLSKQEEASIIFSDLAPVEAKFLENFLGIYNKRLYFRAALSPACNDLLDRMCEFFKEFDKHCKLEVYAAKYNVNTKKKEVTFMKVPRYTRSNANLLEKKIVAPQTKIENIQSVSPFRKIKEKPTLEKLAKPTLSQTAVNNNLKIILSNENTTERDAIQKRYVKFPMNTEDAEEKLYLNSKKREDALSMNAKSREDKLPKNKSIANTTNTDYLGYRENEDVKSTKNITNNDAIDKTYNKEVKLSMNVETKEKKPSTSNSGIKDTSNNGITDTSNSGIKDTSNSGIKDTSNSGTKDTSNSGTKDTSNSGIKDTSNSGIKYTSNSGIKDTSNNGIKDTSNNGIKDTSNNGITDTSNSGIKDTSNSGIKDTSNSGTKDTSNSGTKDTSNSGTKDTSNSGIKDTNNSGIKDTSNSGIKQMSLGPRKDKLLKAMSTPLESDKAMRMMRLMGWQGGALGMRGDGLVEPLIPALHIVPGKGLGHVQEKSNTVIPAKGKRKPPKPPNPPRPPKSIQPPKTSRVERRTRFLIEILNLISKEGSVIKVTYPEGLCDKERRCYKHVMTMLNTRCNVTLTESEDSILMRIQRIMQEKPDLCLDIKLSQDLRELLIEKLQDEKLQNYKKEVGETNADRKRPQTVVKETQDKKNNNNSEDCPIEINRLMSRKFFSVHICLEMLEFLKSGDTEKRIDFDAILTYNYCRIVETVCYCVNKRSVVPFSAVRELCKEMLDYVRDGCLVVQCEARSILLCKVYFPKPCGNNEVVKNNVNKHTNTAIPGADKRTHEIDYHREEGTVEANKQITEVDMITNEATTRNKHHLYTDKTHEKRLTLFNEIMDVDDESIDENIIVVNDEEIDENPQKINECNDLNYDFELNDHIVNNLKVVREINSNKLKENVVRFPLYVKDMSAPDKNDFRRIDMDLIQVTINSLTWHNKKDTESSQLNNKLDTPCKITDNVRKWYAHSEKFLMCDDLVKKKTVKNIDSNNNTNQVTENVELREDFGGKVTNVDSKINTTTERAENSFDVDIAIFSESDLIQIETHNEEDLLDYETDESDESYHTVYDISFAEIHNEEIPSDCGSEQSCESPKTEKTNFRLLYRKYSRSYTKQIEAYNTTNKFEIDESQNLPKEGEIHSKLEMTKIDTQCIANLTRKRKYVTTELDESYEAIEAKHKFDINQVDKKNIEHLRLTCDHQSEDSEDSNTTENLNSEFDIIEKDTDYVEILTCIRKLKME